MYWVREMGCRCFYKQAIANEKQYIAYRVYFNEKEAEQRCLFLDGVQLLYNDNIFIWG